jgi:pSer/pThr/pTyr-binding forkhead associated (FHA) protein
MAGPKLRLLHEGELVMEVPFLGAPLRIGRLKGNDVVINNLSTSRFHATLTEQNGGFVLADLGSENGSWVNERRVKECRVGPGDRIQIGKHDLVIVPAEGAPAAPAALDLTENAPELTDPLPVPKSAKPAARATKKPGDSAPDLSPLDTGAELAAPDEAIEELSASDLGGGELFGDAGPPDAPAGTHDLAQYDVSEGDLQDPSAEEPLALDAVLDEPLDADSDLDAPLAQDAPTALLSDDDADDATQVRGRAHGDDPAGALDVLETGDAPAPAAAEPESLHAGIILQRDGRFERVIQWELDRMTLGRAIECEIVLATPEISRRHALLVRENGRYEVRDLESINGTHVNGEKVSRRELASGDVIRIEDWEMTFVIDRGPISAHVKTEAPPTAEAGAANPEMTQFGEMMDLAPFVAEESAENDANAMSFDNLGAAIDGGELPPIPMPGAAAPIEVAAEPASEPEMPEGLDLPEGLDMPETLEPTELFEEPAPPPALAVEPEPDTVLLADDDGADAPLETEEKDLVEAPRQARILRLELRIRVEELPQPLRDALAHLDPADLRLPVELRLATED